MPYPQTWEPVKVALQASPWERRALVAVGGSRWPYRVLAVESAAGVSAEPAAAMLRHGIELHPFTDGAAALLSLRTEDPAAVMVPTDVAGVELLFFVRAVVAWCDVPVIIGATGSPESYEAAYGAIEAGARALVALPVSGAMLASALQHVGLRKSTTAAPLSYGPIALDREAHRVLVDGAEPHLSPTEFLLLEYLMTEAPRVVAVSEIAAVIGESPDAAVNSVKVRKFVERLRRRLLEADPAARNFLRTVRGHGYRLDAGNA